MQIFALSAMLAGWVAFADDQGTTSPGSEPLVVVVMDPLAKPLSCPCVEGYAQRDYDKLGTHLSNRLGRPVTVHYSDSLVKAMKSKTNGKADVIIGKKSVVEYDAKRINKKVKPIASLTSKEGETM
jgi:hypothetical protein